MQEASDRIDVLAAFLAAHPTWGMYRPAVGGGKAVPILYDAAVWSLTGTKSVLAVGGRFVGTGAGPSWSKPKRINVVTLRGPDGVERPFLNTHMIASATRKGSQYDRRRRHYRDHIAKLVPLLTPDAVLMFDANAEPDFRLLAPVRNSGIGGWTIEPTHGDRAIDHVLGPDGGRTVVRLSSDHRAVLAEL